MQEILFTAGARRIRYHQAMLDSEMYYKEFADKMRFYKQDEEGVKMASKIIEEYGDIRAAEALKQGIQQGAQRKAIEDAKKLLADGKYTALEISELLNIPVEDFAE